MSPDRLAGDVHHGRRRNIKDRGTKEEAEASKGGHVRNLENGEGLCRRNRKADATLGLALKDSAVMDLALTLYLNE